MLNGFRKAQPGACWRGYQVVLVSDAVRTLDPVKAAKFLHELEQG